MSVFSECLNLIRINKNLYAADIARLIDMDASTISKWLNSERKPKNREVLTSKFMDINDKDVVESYIDVCRYLCDAGYVIFVKIIHRMHLDLHHKMNALNARVYKK